MIPFVIVIMIMIIMIKIIFLINSQQLPAPYKRLIDEN